MTGTIPALASVKTFGSIEALRAEYAALTGAAVPRMTAGRHAFFQDFASWSQGTEARGRSAFGIPPDPSYALVYPCPRDEIKAAFGVAGTPADEATVLGLLSEYGIEGDVASRGTPSLSGGERLLTTFAKAEALAPWASSLVACSPGHWLSAGRYGSVERLVRAYVARGKAATILMLDGEALPIPSLEYVPAAAGDTTVAAGPEWQLQIAQPVIAFPGTHFPRPAMAKIIRYAAASERVRLRSPTLLMGDNGVGKSVFARALAGVIPVESGSLAPACAGITTPARLLFQDSIDQLFGFAIDDHLNHTFRFDQELRKKALALADALEARLRQYVLDHAHLDAGVLGATPHDSMLQSKVVLAAERLTSAPPLLVLDEPGWCLSAELARAFVGAVCMEAHRLRIAVLIISHQRRWWDNIAASALSFARAPGASDVVAIAVEDMASW